MGAMRMGRRSGNSITDKTASSKIDGLSTKYESTAAAHHLKLAVEELIKELNEEQIRRDNTMAVARKIISLHKTIDSRKPPTPFGGVVKTDEISKLLAEIQHISNRMEKIELPEN